MNKLSFAALPLLSVAEHQRVVVEWNATQASYPSERCIQQLFEEQAGKAPDAVAVVDGDTRLTYGELNTRANRLAYHLRAMGVRPEMRIALCIERSAGLIVGLLAVLKSGGAYVPLDPSYPLDRLSYLLEDSVPAVVLTDTTVNAPVRELLTKSGVATLDLEADAAIWTDLPAVNLARAGLLPEHAAYVIYTSGSTGQPKGVLVEHRQLVARLWTAHAVLGVVPSDVMPNLASQAFDISLLELLLPLVAGGSTQIVRTSAVMDVEQLIAQTQSATIFHAVPSLMQSWLECVETQTTPVYESLRMLLVGGEAVPPSLLTRVRRRFPTVGLLELYGPTETTMICTAYRVGDAVVANPCIGRPLANSTTYILDGFGAPAPIGVVGELYVGGAGVARGYLNRPDLTAERYVPHPFVGGERLYKTGDTARYLADGTIEYLGRNDLQVKIRGFRIELGEIEARLSAHGSIREVVVLAREDVPSHKHLVAYYTLEDGVHAPSVEELRTLLLSVLPEYMVPAAYVRLESLPLTVNGKVDRQSLPAPDGSAYRARTYEAPVGEIETALAEIWREVLKVGRVGRHDNFFELGGHSLLAVRVISQMHQAALSVDVRTLFTAPTIAGLAATVGQGNALVKVPPSAIPADAQTITPEMLTLW